MDSKPDISGHNSGVSKDAKDFFNDFDDDDSDVDENALRLRGKEDIKREISGQQLEAIIQSVKRVKRLKDINFEQIKALVLSFQEFIRQISCESRTWDRNNYSYFGHIYQKSSYRAIPSTVETSLFSKSQKSYTLGCLYGLFPESDRLIGSKIFSVLLPETLVIIAMISKEIDYKTALDLFKPMSLSID